MPSRGALASLIAAGALTALPAAASEPLAVTGNDVAAIYRDGTVTLAEVAHWRLAHPESATTPGPPSLEEVRRIALAKHLAAAAMARGAERQPALADLLASQADNVLARALRRHLVAESRSRVGDEEVEAAFQEHPEAFRKPERRRLRNLFKRYPPAADADARAAVLAEVEGLRHQVVSNAADFATLARERSDSQNRFRDGLIGNAEAGELPPAVEAVAWELGPGEVSRPLLSADGVTLLFCEEILPPVEPAPEEVRRRLRENLEGIAVREDWATLQAAVQARASQGEPASPPRGEIASHELGAEARARGLDELPEVHSRLTWQRLDALALDELRSRVEMRFSEPTEAEVRAYHAAHPERFKAPPELDLLAIRLGIESGAEGVAHQEAERLLADLRAGEIVFSEAARRFSIHPSASSGGALGWVPGPRLAGLGANVWKAAMALAPGQLSEVVEQDGALWILRLEAARPRRPASFEESAEVARKRLADEVLARLQREIEDEVLSLLAVRLATAP